MISTIRHETYAASSTTVARKNSVLLSLEITTTGSKGVSSSSSLLPDAVFVGSSMPGATSAAAPSAVSANLATEYPLRDLSQKPLKSFYIYKSLFFVHSHWCKLFIVLDKKIVLSVETPSGTLQFRYDRSIHAEVHVFNFK